MDRALIVEGAKKLVNDLISQVEQHILGEAIGKAVAPLEQVGWRAAMWSVATALLTAA